MKLWLIVNAVILALVLIVMFGNWRYHRRMRRTERELAESVLKRTWGTHLLACLALVFLLFPATALADGGQTFRIGVKVTAPVGTTVLVRWRVSCTNGGIARQTHGEYRTEVPDRHRLRQSLPGATSCYVRAVGWNVGHPHGDHPVLDTWVVAL